MSKDVKCPHCSKDNNYHEIKLQVEEDIYHDLISVQCAHCCKFFQVEIEFITHKPEFKGTGKCTCDPVDWRDGKPGPVCDNFIADNCGICENCEHDEACH